MTKFLQLLAVLVVLGLIGWLVVALQPPVTAESLAKQMQQQGDLPRDLGDGFRLDSIVASGNDVVTTISLTRIDKEQATSALADKLTVASKTDACQEIASNRKHYIDAHIRVVKTYKDKNGAEIVSVVVDPNQCT